MKNKILLFVFFMILFLNGCQKPTTTETTFNQSEIEKKDDINTSSTKKFDLGTYKYKASSGKELSYRLRGVMSFPKEEGKYPLILIAHGNHENISEDKRFDTGFKYLTEKLANNGFVAVSLDLSKAYIWKYGDGDEQEKMIAMINKYLEVIYKNNKSDDNLKDRIDFNKIGIIGHSRGGEMVFNLADSLKNTDKKISAILAVAPTNSNVDTKLLTTDIKTSIIVPELDGDVIGLDGYSIYDKLKSKKRQNTVSITLLEDANHNYFNDNLTRNDASFSYNIKEDTKQLSKEEQQEFLGDYAVDFFNYSLKDKIDNSFYDTKVSSINKMYGYGVKTLLTNNKTTSLVDLKNKDNFTSDGVKINLTQDALFYKDDLEPGINTPLGGNHIRKLLSIKWTEKNKSLSFIPKFKDFSNFNSLSIDILQDPSDKLNENIDYQSFSVVLEDKNKNKSIIDLGDNITALEKYDGEFEYTDLDDIKIEYWSRQTFISEIRIPLSNFSGVDLKNINKVSLLFNKKDSGAIMIENIQLK